MITTHALTENTLITFNTLITLLFEDMDECALGKCHGECVNNMGSYTCSCPDTFTVLAPDGHTCTCM